MSRDHVGCAPAGTVLRNNDFRSAIFQGFDCRCDDRLEHRPGQMKSADDRMDLIYTGQFPRASERVDNAGVTAAG